MTAKTQLDLIECVLDGAVSIRDAIRICEVYAKDDRSNDLKPLPFHLEENEKSQKFVQRDFIKVNKPEFKENLDAINIVQLTSKVLQKSFRESPRGKEWNRAQVRGNLHYRPKMKLSYVPNGEKINDNPEITNKELGYAKAKITREQKAKRKLMVAEKMAIMPNATTREIERFAFMTMYRDM